MLRTFARWREMELGERWLVLRLLVALPAISALTSVFGVVRTIRVVERLSSRNSPREAGAVEMESAERLTQLVAAIGRRGAITATCLPQALLVYGLLRRRGLVPTLMVGVRRAEDTFDAHAWVRLQGVELGQSELDHTPFPIRNWNLAAR